MGSTLESLLKKYYNKTMICFRANEDNKIFHSKNLACKLLDRPIQIKWKEKVPLLTLYRKDNINYDFSVDGDFVKLVNKSRKINSKAWAEYLGTDDGEYGYCSSEQLYKLVENCYL